MTRRRIPLVALAAVAVLSAVAWYGDLPSAIPLQTSMSEGDEPLLQSPEAARRLFERRLALSGGVPHDARLTWFRPYTHRTMIIARMRGSRAGRPIPGGGRFDLSPVPGQVGATSVTGYMFELQPVGAVALFDRIGARVDAETVRTCLDGGTLLSPYGMRSGLPTCRHYRMTFPLRLSSLTRTWRPRLVRALSGWWDRRTAPMVAAPATVVTGCPRTAGDAMRRIMAANSAPLMLKGRFRAQALWEPSVSVARAGRGALATWDAPYPSVRFPGIRWYGPDHVAIREAVVLDEPIGDRPERLILVRYNGLRAKNGDDVAALQTSSEEAVCPPVRQADVPAPVVRWTWDTMVAIVRERAHDEGLWLAAFRGPAVTATVTGSARHPDGTSEVDVDTRQGAERWRARFTIDEREPAIREAEFTRL